VAKTSSASETFDFHRFLAKLLAHDCRGLPPLKRHSAEVLSVTFSPQGQRIVTGSSDQTAKVWETARAGQVAAWQEEERTAARSPAGLQREQTAE